MKNQVIITMMDEGGPMVALQVSVQGDLTQGAGRMAAFILKGLALPLATEGIDIAGSYPSDVQAMIAFHLGADHDEATNRSPSDTHEK